MMLSPNSSQAAYYTENRPGRIYFNNEVSLSSSLKGLLLLHEAKHAEIFETNQFRDGNELDHWLEEAAVFEFEFRLLRNLCGTPYDEMMDKTVARFIEEYGDKDDSGRTLPEPDTMDIRVVDEIFGPILSEREPSLRKSIVWMHATFRMLEAKYPEVAEIEKAKFLRHIYSQ